MVAYLLKLEVESNKNRYYKMVEKGDYFEIEYGRVGATPFKSKRPMYLWDETYKKHITEGYVDRSDYLTITEETKGQYKPIEDNSVREMVDFLLASANQTIRDNYTVSYKEVSLKMVEDAQDLIYELSLEPTLSKANQILPKLFVVIPRKMKDTNECIPKLTEEVPEILQREQDLLDVMRNQVVNMGLEEDSRMTILDANNLKISLVTDDKEISQVRKHLGEVDKNFSRVFKVYNEETDKAFDKYVKEHHIGRKDIHFYYHGSKNMNYWSLITQGQKLNPKAPITGKMFGHGLYYANLARKARGYTSLRGSYWARGKEDVGYLAVFKVAYKDPLHVQAHQRWMCNIRSKKDIDGKDALFAHGGIDLINDEIIIYDENQVTLRYLIELKN